MRIYFDAWGEGNFKVPTYALLRSDEMEYTTKTQAVVSAIARKNRMECCAGPQNQGTALDIHGNPEADHYSFTLGIPCGGGYSPRYEVWISIPRNKPARRE